MSIATAILLIGACGSASRTMVVEPSIGGILIRVVAGGVQDVALSMWGRVSAGETGWTSNDEFLQALQRGRAVLAGLNPTLRIDGQPRTGVIAWIAAAHRVAGYALDRRTNNGDAAGVGSVEYAYRLRVRGFDIRRSTRISDGRVSLVTDVYGSIGPRGELNHARITITASETVHGTMLAATATGWSHIGDRCRLVARMAGRQIGKELDIQLLGRIQRGGIDLYRASAIGEILK